MSVFRSENYRLSIVEEPVYGYKTGTTIHVPSEAVYPIGLLNGYEPPDPNVEWKPFRKIGQEDSRNIEEFVEGKHEHQGNVPFTVQDARIIAMAFGQESVTGSDPYTHTITGASELPSFSMNVSRLTSGVTNDYNRMFTGCKIDSLTLAAEDSGELKANASIVSQNVTETNNVEAPTVTALNDEPYWFHQSAVTFWGSTIGRLQSFEMSLTNDLRPKRYYKDAPANSLSELLEGERKFSIKAGIAIDDMSIYALLEAGTAFDISLLFTRGASDTFLISSGIDPDMSINEVDALNCRITGAPHSVPETNEVIVPVEMVVKNMYIKTVDDTATYLL